MMTRADLWLVKNGFAKSRTQAQEMINQKRVRVIEDSAAFVIEKVSTKLADNVQIEIEPPPTVEFVSRGGVKLRGALDYLKLNVRALTALDIGISTGGFTDCLLKAGVTQVVGIDVGHNQLAPELCGDSRLTLIEGVNARDLGGIQLIAHRKFDLIVVDVSFISLTLVLPSVVQYLSNTGSLLALVKPQFEVGKGGLGKNGIVKDPKQYHLVEMKIREKCSELGIIVKDYFASSIKGGDGNEEFFIYALK